MTTRLYIKYSWSYIKYSNNIAALNGSILPCSFYDAKLLFNIKGLLKNTIAEYNLKKWTNEESLF